MEKFLTLGEYKGLGYEELVDRIALDYSETRNTIEEYALLVAMYNDDVYEGYGYLLLQDRKTSKYFEVHSSHCSCYFLEGQFTLEPLELRYVRSKHYNAYGHEERIRQFIFSELRKAKIDTIINN
jgi:hypothetical protein